MKNSKKIVSLLLSLLMVFGVFNIVPFSVMAAETDSAVTGAESGTTGDCTWTLDGTVLTISGNGYMGYYNYSYKAPWGTAITKVILTGGVTSIGSYAFFGCSSLTNITIPHSVTSIGEDAFSNCSGLKSIIIPDSVTSIGEYAFRGCDSLTDVTIPDSVTLIEHHAFGYDMSDEKIEGFIIYGNGGTTAETYANENGFTFVDIGHAPPKPTLSFTPKYSYEYIENYNGYRETDGSDGFVYYAPTFFNDGDKLSINYHDDRGTVDYYYDVSWRSFKDDKDNEIHPDDIKCSQGYGWTVGGENTFTLTYKNMSTEVPVSVVKPKDASIRFIPKKPYELIENREGYMDDGYFWYYAPDMVKGDKLIIDYGDKSVTYIYGSKPDGPFDNKKAFYDEDGNSIPYRMSTDQDNKHFTLGSDNYFIITAAGKTAIIPVTVIEYPVESIEFKLAGPIVMYENQDGYYYDHISEDGYVRSLQVDENGYYYYDYYTAESEKIYTEPEGFYYTQVPLYKDGNQLIIHNKDGSTKTLTQRFIFTEEDHGYFFVDENGDYDNNVTFDWDGTSFKLGSDNLLTVTYLDTTTTVPVTIVENNIESIEYQPVKPIVYNLDDPKDVLRNENIVGSFYNPYKIRETGTVLTARFKDGSTKKYNIYSVAAFYNGVYNPVLASRYFAVDEEGSVIGYSSLKFDYKSSDWTPGNTYYMTVSYLGATTQVPISVIDKTTEEPVIGDADGDGQITTMDVTEVQHYLSTMTTHVDEESLMYADVDKNGVVDIIDVTWLLRHLAGMEIPYTIG